MVGVTGEAVVGRPLPVICTSHLLDTDQCRFLTSCFQCLLTSTLVPMRICFSTKVTHNGNMLLTNQSADKSPSCPVTPRFIPGRCKAYMPSEVNMIDTLHSLMQTFPLVSYSTHLHLILGQLVDVFRPHDAHVLHPFTDRLVMRRGPRAGGEPRSSQGGRCRCRCLDPEGVVYTF